MKHKKVARKTTGFSLIEMMVSLGIMSIVMLGAYQLFSEGMQLFRVNQAAADAQAGVTKVAGALASELTNAAPQLTKHHGPPYVPGGAPGGGGGGGAGGMSGISFATPLDSNGKVRYDEVNGRLYWQRYVAYFFQPDPSGGYNGAISRGEQNVAGEPGEAAGGTGNRDLDLVENFLNTHAPNYFATNGAVKRRRIASGISGLFVQPYDANEDFGTTAVKEGYDVFIEAGDKTRAFRNSYFIRVRVRVVPGAR